MAPQGPRPKFWEVFPKDFWGDGDVDALDDPVHRCAYLALLSWAWERGARLRNPIAALRSIGFSDADASSIWQALLPLWTEHSDGWTQGRLDRDYTKATERRALAIERAQKGAKGRWGASGDAPSKAKRTAPRNQRAMPSDSDSDSDSGSVTGFAGTDQKAPTALFEAPPPAKAKKPKPEELLEVALRQERFADLARSPAFVEAMREFLADRRERGVKPYTARGLDKQLLRLAGWGVERATAALVFSATQQFQGIFEERSNGPHRQNGAGHRRPDGTYDGEYPEPAGFKIPII